MDLGETSGSVGAVITIAAMFLLPRWLSFRARAVSGAFLCLLGWSGVFGGLALGDQPFMQSEAVAFTWMGISALAIVLAITLLVPVFVEWLKERRKPRRTRERWRSGHWKSSD